MWEKCHFHYFSRMTLLTFPTFDSTHFTDFSQYRLLTNSTIDNRELTKNEAQFAFDTGSAHYGRTDQSHGA